MATNPLYRTNDSPNNQTQPTRAVNRQGVYVPRTHNSFDNSYFNYKSQKFGQYEPFFVMEGVPGDNIPLHSSHQVRSLPMATPFLSELSLNKDYFMIPNQAIQPNTWDYIYVHPNQGDDIPEDAQNVFPIYDGSLQPSDSWLFPFLFDRLPNLENAEQVWALLVLENFFSAGSLLNYLGYRQLPMFRVNDGKWVSFDDLFEDFFTDAFISISIVSDNFSGVVSSDEVGIYTVLSLMRRYGSNCFIQECEINNITSITYLGLTSGTNTGHTKIRMDRVCAYQLACSQYYVNPQVDFIYNSQLYRDNFIGLLRDLVSEDHNLEISFFDRNGISVPYDYFSEKYYEELTWMMRYVFDQQASDTLNSFAKLYDIISYVFGFRESLRFGDYLTDCRTRPLAIGDNHVAVSSEGVDVIDMSKKIIFQRFRNAVVKLGQNFGDYLRGIMGTDPSPDYHIPKFIAHQDFKIGGFEVANTTSENQGNLVTNLKTADDTFAFEVTCDMPCVIIGMSYMSVPRLYSQVKDRHFFHLDRFDMFNPMLQYIGDQPVYNEERTQFVEQREVFGYQSRYGEYKQRLSVAGGAFVEYLPAWSFITDSIFDPVTDIALSDVQSPDFIRAHDFEFNRFFKAVAGVSLAKGYHFIMVYNNKCMSNRPMEVNPSTL